MSREHVIGRKLFELEFYSRSEAPMMQSTVSRIVQDKLKHILENALDQYAETEDQIFIDQLQINLGDIPYDELEQEFPERFQKELERLLPALIEKTLKDPDQDNYVQSKKESMLEVFRQFINTGTVPWWLTESASVYLSDALAKLAAEKRSELAELIRTDAQQIQVLRRIVLQFSDTQLETIVRVLEPAEADFIIAYSRELDSSAERKTIEQIRPGNAFRNIKWELIIGYLVSDRGSDFNRKSFLRFTIAGLAAHYNISFVELLRQLITVTTDLVIPVGAASSLPALLRELQMEDDADLQKENDSANFSQQQSKISSASELVSESELQLFSYLLRFNSLPHWAAGTGKTELRMIIQKLLLKEPAGTLQRLAKLAHFEETVSHFMEYTDPQQWMMTVKIAEPADAEQVGVFVNNLTRFSKEDERIAITEKEFNKSVWRFVLEYILRNYGTEFSSRNFVRTTLRQIARRYSIAYSDLLDLLLQTIQQKKNNSVWSPSLAKVILLLAEESSETHVPVVSATEKIAQKSASVQDSKMLPGKTLSNGNDQALFTGNEGNAGKSDRVNQAEPQMLADILFHYFSSGQMPWWTKGKFSNADLNAMITRLLNQSKPLMVNLVVKLKQNEESFNRFTNRISRQQLTIIFKMVSGETAADSFQQWTEKLEKEIARKTGKPAQAKAFLFRLQLRLLHRMPGTKNGSFRFSAFFYEMIGELKAEFSFSVSDILLLMADATAALPAGSRPQMLSVLKQMHRDKGQLLYNEIAREEKLTADRLLFEEWLKQPTKSFTEKRETGFFEAASAWIEIVIGNDKPFISGTKGLSWKEIYDTLIFLYPGRKDELLPLIRKQFDAYSKLSSEKIFPVAGFEEIFDWLVYSKISSAGATAIRQSLEVQIQKLLSSHPLLSRDVFGQWLDSAYIRKQLAAQVSNQTLSELIALFSSGNSALGSTLIYDLFALREKLTATISEQAEKNALKEAALFFANRMKKIPLNSVEWIQTMLHVTGKTSGIDSHLLAASWKQFAMRYAFEWRSDLLLILDHLSDPVYLDRLGDRFLARLKKMEEDLKKEQEEAAKKKEKQNKPEDIRDRINIKNAGLILVAPYLSRLFARLNYVETNLFVSEEARQKAIALLQFMADPDSELNEADLTLNKILCGLDLSEPIDKWIVPDENEKEISQSLLESVIKNWPVLGNTTVETFRESFLRRNGGILFANDKWEMRVENKAYDKLLMKLPWSINMVRLPWMKNTIITEWKT